MKRIFRAMVIDEDSATTQTVSRSLNRLGCEIVPAGPGDDGLERIALENVDIVFVSLCARHMGGREVARWIKNHNLSTKAVVMTNWKGELDRSILYMEGIESVINKPPSFGAIRKTLFESLG